MASEAAPLPPHDTFWVRACDVPRKSHSIFKRFTAAGASNCATCETLSSTYKIATEFRFQ